MAVNLFEKNSKTMQNFYAQESLVAGRLSDDYEFTGAKTVKVLTPMTVPMNDYRRTGTNRYGQPVEMQDIIQEMTLTQDKAFSLTIDKGNFKDQGMLKSAGRMMALQLKERAVPAFDKYVLGVLAHKAGTIFGSDTAISKNNIVERISNGTQVLDDGEVPRENRTLYITAENFKFLKLAPEWLGIPELGKKALAKGQIGEYDDMTVVKVPKSRMPANVNFIIVHKAAALAPVKIHEGKVHKDPPGISGNLLEGREYYDCFVRGPMAVGVYVDVTTGSGKATICAAPTVASNGAVTSTTAGASFKFTTDGSDPRYSASAEVGATVPTAAETVVKVYAFKADCFDSPVTEHKFA